MPPFGAPDHGSVGHSRSVPSAYEPARVRVGRVVLSARSWRGKAGGILLATFPRWVVPLVAPLAVFVSSLRGLPPFSHQRIPLIVAAGGTISALLYLLVFNVFRSRFARGD